MMMKKIIAITILAITLLFACKSTKSNQNEANNYTKNISLEGDLYFNWLRVGNFYNMKDTAIINISKQLTDLKNSETQEDKSLLTLFSVLKDSNLLYSPYIEVVLENDVHTTWYLSTADYDTIKQFKLRDLDANNEKLHISAELQKILPNAYKCLKITEIKLLEKGDYNNSDKKFNAKDYQ